MDTLASRAPFHEGERAIHQRLGLGPRIEEIGQRVIRPALPEQHRAFFAQLPYVMVGSVDADQRPWASVLAGAPGFIQSPTPRTLHVGARPLAGDPLAAGLQAGAPLGFLGIELATRRRNRVNGHVAEVGASGFTLDVDQTVGNCPQYIHPRELVHVDGIELPGRAEPLSALDAEARTFIARADTLFVASHAPATAERPDAGVDVSHRGGPAGFVQIDDDGDGDGSLVVPDYRGNFFFMTLGNLAVEPRAGLLFIDFATGDLLTLTGTTEILWSLDGLPDMPGAQRAWRFRMTAGWRLRAALPLRWHPEVDLDAAAA